MPPRPNKPQLLPTARVSNTEKLKLSSRLGMRRELPTRTNPPRPPKLTPRSFSLPPQLMVQPVPDVNTQPRPLMEPKHQDHSARRTRKHHSAAVQPTSTLEMEPDLPSRPAKLPREPTTTSTTQNSRLDQLLPQPQKCGDSTASKVPTSSPPPLLPSELLITWSEMFERHMDVNYICETFRE